MQSTVGFVPNVSRRLRNPQHNFALRHSPFAIAPFLLAPVLPGETMKNLSFQARVVTKPIKNPLIGWWIEFYIFYVKHRDLSNSALYQSMVLDPGVDIATGNGDYENTTVTDGGGATAYGFHTGKGINWGKACTSVVVKEYFRSETEAAAGFNLVQGGLYNAAAVNLENWTDSLTLQSTMTPLDPSADADASGTITVSEVDRALRTYEMMLAGGLVNMTYEDWLRSYGVRQSQAVRNVPELIRYVREWTYPSSHIDPVTGSASSACSWSVAERADKDRFFAEPGFIFGVTVCRPKVYFGNLKQPGASLMNDAYSWLPAILRDDAASSIKKVTDSADDPLGGVATTDWYVDIKDLLIYGDQLVNYALAAADSNIVAMPAANMTHRFPTDADIAAMFVTPANGLQGVQMDGVCRLSILGTQTDTTPQGSTFAGGSF